MAYAGLLNGDASQDQDQEAEQPQPQCQIRPPLSRWLALIPILSGLVFIIVTWSERLLVKIFGRWCPETLAVPCVFAGVVLMTSAVPTYYISVVTKSEAFKNMLNEKIAGSACDRDFVARFKKRMDQIPRDCFFDMLAMMTVLALICWLAFETLASCALFSIVGGSISFTTRSQLSFLDRLVELCDKDIDVYINEQLPADGSAKVDWQAAVKEHYALDLRMEKLWAPQAASMIILPLVAREVVLGGTLLVMGVILEDPMHEVAAWLLGGVLIFRGVLALKGPARITKRCTDASTSAGRYCIKAAANAVCVRNISDGKGMNPEEEVAHMKYVQYLNTTTTGVELFGVPVTFALILQLMSRAVTGLPIAVGLLENIVHL